MDSTRILLHEERATVLKDLHRRRRYPMTRRNKIIFRLSCCCGLRRKEIAGLNVNDVIVGGPRPCIRIRKGITKGRNGERRARTVPLWHDSETLTDLAKWIECRVKMGAGAHDPLVCKMHRDAIGTRMIPMEVSRGWKVAIRALGKERVRQLSVHKGRHTCASILLDAGYSLATIRDWLGHRNIAITNIYVHAIAEDRIRDVFAPRPLAS